jgi:hypothetical protein
VRRAVCFVPHAEGADITLPFTMLVRLSALVGGILQSLQVLYIYGKKIEGAIGWMSLFRVRKGGGLAVL